MQDLAQLYELVLNRKNNPQAGSYTDYLFTKGLDKILKKIGEEATEVIVAAKILTRVNYNMKLLIYFII